jgi:hypothetical protein
MTRAVKLTVILAFGFLLVACAQQPTSVSSTEAPGFLLGVVHGLLSVFSLIGHALGLDVRVYAYPNAGGWYDAGFVLGCMLLFGGGASTY